MSIFLKGAYILDSIMNYNQSAGSQTTPKMYGERLNPEFIEAVKKDEEKGNFISLISRGPDDNEMFDRFQLQWKSNNVKSKQSQNATSGDDESMFKIHKMELLDGKIGQGFEGGRFPSRQVMMNNTDLLRSDHAAFWFSNNRDYYASLKAIHISDTGNSYISMEL